MNKAFLTILYERLSRDDPLQGESNSITNQKRLLEEYAEKYGYTPYLHFTDDGVSGTRFDRPGFMAMMEKINAGTVRRIIVKDMSRLGRDYLQVGQLMELLRQKEIHLIAINDGVDTIRGEDEFTPFRNIINEWYAKDISKKLKSSFRTKGMTGKHISGSIIYGYLWDEKRENWIVDEEAAEVVRRIFRLTLDGKGPYQIASILAQDKIDVPMVHLQKHQQGLAGSRKIKNDTGWCSSSVASILSRKEYLGHTYNFKTTKYFKDSHSHPIPPNQWVEFKNTHEPIIDQETFDLVQKIRGNCRRYPDGFGELHALSGRMFCGACGEKMYLQRIHNGKILPAYQCSKYYRSPHQCIANTRISEAHVLEIITRLLRQLMKAETASRNEFYQEIQASMSKASSSEETRLNSKLTKGEKRLEELRKILCKLYEDNALGNIPQELYTVLDQQYLKEQNKLLTEREACLEKLRSLTSFKPDLEKFNSLLEKYQDFTELTPEMIATFIDKIVVYERSEKYRKTGITQKIDIYLNFVGKIDSLKTAALEQTPEEQEASRIKAEKHKKQQEIYQRRKESGKAKAYYERNKEKYKAYRKANREKRIREAQEKGIFKYIKDLPDQQPVNGDRLLAIKQVEKMEKAI